MRESTAFNGRDVSGRPPALIVASAYFAVFSAYALYVLLHGALHMRSSMADAFFPLIVCVTAACIPAVVAAGLWMMDEVARIAACWLMVLHALSTIAWMSQVASEVRPGIRLALDAVVLALLFSRSARQACSWVPIPRFH